MLFSYIGPETMMPVASVIAAVAGVFMMFGRSVDRVRPRPGPPRLARFVARRWRRSPAREGTDEP